MSVKNGIHWHGKHENGLHNPGPSNVDRWRRVVDAAAPLIEALGVKVINTSMDSALKRYEKTPLVEAIRCLINSRLTN